MSEIVAAGRRHDKALGRNVPNVEEGRRAFAEGFDFLTYSGDIWLYRSALADGVARLRGACVETIGQAATSGR
jgi:2-dehydro-3-deoxyglucarate aldolase/4-hydroxy-2-oxoheptanedioate aldolase